MHRTVWEAVFCCKSKMKSIWSPWVISSSRWTVPSGILIRHTKNVSSSSCQLWRRDHISMEVTSSSGPAINRFDRFCIRANVQSDWRDGNSVCWNLTIRWCTDLVHTIKQLTWCPASKRVETNRRQLSRWRHTKIGFLAAAATAEALQYCMWTKIHCSCSRNRTL